MNITTPKCMSAALGAAVIATFAAGDESAGVDSKPAARHMVVHEWGTFTTVHGSDGSQLPGLEVEEEPLPPFTFAHDGLWSFTKGFRRPLSNVTVRMETPVLYFYSGAEEPFSVSVDVGFRGGSISQWYPQRTGGETPPPLKLNGGKVVSGEIDFAAPYEGSIAWEAEVLPASPANDALAFKPGESLTWVYPRQTDANVLRTAAGEHEKFLFYRGVGNFEVPITFTVDETNTLHAAASPEACTVPEGFVFRLDKDGQGGIARLQPEGGEAARVAVALDDIPRSREWRRDVYDTLAQALDDAGLYRREADAMVQTWWRSYFEQPGVRVFWIVPRQFTDRILPLKIEPAPYDTVRVLVGRSEILTPAFEDELAAAWQNEDTWAGFAADRYARAYEARLQELGVIDDD